MIKRCYSIFCFLALCLCAHPSTHAAEKPNIIFIVMDDLNDWVLDPAQGISTPNLDRLRASGVTFMNAHCAAPQCHPSRVAVMTGVRPSTSGIDHNVYDRKQASWRVGPDSGTGALRNVIVLSQYFREHGYRAVGGGKIFHALQWANGSENEPGDWDEYFPDALHPIPFQVRSELLEDDATDGVIGQRPLGGKADKQYFGASPILRGDADMSDYKVASWAVSELQRPQSKPLFLAVGLFRPHMPWEVPEKYFDHYPLKEVHRPPYLEDDLADTHGQDRVSWHEWVMANEPQRQMWERLIQGYKASISFSDAQLGRVLDALAASPLARNSIVVLWSDNGMHFGEKKAWEKFTLWERSTHVPLIFRAPGVAAPGSRVLSPASLVDIYPTLCELAGLPVPSQCEGTSLMPQLRDSLAPRTIPAITTQTRGKQSGNAVRDERFRYILYFDGTEELYDHQTDPNEWHNIAADQKYAPVKARLREWLVRIHAPLDGKYAPRVTGTP